MVTDGKAEALQVMEERVMPVYPHKCIFRCILAWCYRVRGLDGSTVLRVDLLLHLSQGWF